MLTRACTLGRRRPKREALHHLPKYSLHLLPKPPPRAIDAALDALPKLLRGAADVVVRAGPLALDALALPPLGRGSAKGGLALRRGVHEAHGREAVFGLAELEVRGGEERDGALGRGGAREEVQEEREGEEEEVAEEPEVVVPLWGGRW